MKDYNFSNNYENLNSWTFEKDVITESAQSSSQDQLLNFLKSYPNLLNSLKSKKILYIPSLFVLAGVGIVEIVSLIPIINIKRLEATHYEYEDKVNSLNDINKYREEKFQDLIEHTSLMSNPSPSYLFAFFLQETMPKNVQLVDYTVDNVGFKLNAISNDIVSTKKFISLLIENKIIDNKTLKIERLVSQSSNNDQENMELYVSNNETIVLEITGKLYQLPLKDRIKFHNESKNYGVFNKLTTYKKLLELLR